MWIFSSNANNIALDYILDNINNQNVIDIDEGYFWMYISDNKAQKNTNKGFKNFFLQFFII